MKYNIISINDSRKAYTDVIRKCAGFDEVDIPAVNAHEVNLHEELERRGVAHHGDLWGNPKIGELGVWLSNFDCWQWAADNNETLIVFEDDAIIDDTFQEQIKVFSSYLPDDWDFAALWVPENQLIDYNYDVTYNEWGDAVHHGMRLYSDSLFTHTRYTAHVYQGYGMVSLMYSPRGAQKLVDLVRETGIYTPVDCYVYQRAHKGDLNGFAPTPLFANIVKYDWKAVSHVQLTERF